MHRIIPRNKRSSVEIRKKKKKNDTREALIKIQKTSRGRLQGISSRWKKYCSCSRGIFISTLVSLHFAQIRIRDFRSRGRIFQNSVWRTFHRKNNHRSRLTNKIKVIFTEGLFVTESHIYTRSFFIVLNKLTEVIHVFSFSSFFFFFLRKLNINHMYIQINPEIREKMLVRSLNIILILESETLINTIIININTREWNEIEKLPKLYLNKVKYTVRIYF